MPPEERLGNFSIKVVYREGHYIATVGMSFGTREIIQRGLALKEDHEQTEELAFWIDAVATTVQADRQARADNT
jgi:hypothetical protein